MQRFRRCRLCLLPRTYTAQAPIYSHCEPNSPAHTLDTHKYGAHIRNLHHRLTRASRNHAARYGCPPEGLAHGPWRLCRVR
jgi:hypothetical protein